MTDQKDPTKKTFTDNAVIAASAVLQSAPFPFAGGLAKYLDEYYPSQQKRLLTYLSGELLKHGCKVDELSCNLDRLGIMVNEIIFQLCRTSSETKRLSYYNLLLNYSSGKTSEDRTLEYYMQTLSDLTELQLQILMIALDPMKYAIDRNLVNNEEQKILQNQIDNNLVIKDFTENQRRKKNNLPDNSISKEAREVLSKVTIDDALVVTQDLYYPAYKGLISKSLIVDLNVWIRRDNPRTLHFASLEISELGKDFVSWILFEKE